MDIQLTSLLDHQLWEDWKCQSKPVLISSTMSSPNVKRASTIHKLPRCGTNFSLRAKLGPNAINALSKGFTSPHRTGKTKDHKPFKGSSQPAGKRRDDIAPVQALQEPLVDPSPTHYASFSPQEQQWYLTNKGNAHFVVLSCHSQS